MATLKELKELIQNANEIGIKNLKEKNVGIFTSSNIISTEAIMNAIALINTGEDLAENEKKMFWDAFQDNGNRTDYKNAFYGQGWNDTTFKPQYNITPIGDAGSIFQNCKITNLKEILEKNNVTLDFSGTTVLSYPFQNSTITHLGTLDCRNITNLGYILTDSKMMEGVDKIILKEDGSQTFGTFAFRFDTKLKEIRFEGAIGQSLSFIHCNSLSSDSVQDIIDHLATVASPQTITFHSSIALTDEQKSTISGKGWTLVQ